MTNQATAVHMLQRVDDTQGQERVELEPVEAFAIAVLEQLGGRLNPVAPGVWDCLLPESRSVELGWQRDRSTRLLFRRDVAQGDLEARYVSVGSPTFDALVEICRSEGSTAHLVAAGFRDGQSVELEIRKASGVAGGDGNPDEEVELLVRSGSGKEDAWLWRLPVCGASVELEGRRHLLQRQALFEFRVRFAPGDDGEMRLSLLGDPVTERVVPLPNGLTSAYVSWPALDRAGGRGSSARRGQPAVKALLEQAEWLSRCEAERLIGEHLKGRDYVLARLYASACDAVERWGKEELGRRTARMHQDRERERARLISYYKALQEETVEPLRKLFRRIAASTVRADLARTVEAAERYTGRSAGLKEEAQSIQESCESELAALKLEEELRLSELEERFRLRARVALSGAAWVWVPRTEFALVLRQGLPNSRRKRRSLVLLWDILRGEPVDFRCEGCEGPIGRLHLCSDGHLTCGVCGTSCVDCGRRICTLCSVKRCHVCGSLVCKRCGHSCGWKGGSVRVAGVSQLAVCNRCQSEICPACQVGVGY